MGAWGSGSFENDAAMDWAAGVKSIDDVRAPFDRLNPDIEPRPWTPEEVKQEVGAPAGPCCFCGEMVTQDAMFMMKVFDATNRLAGNRGFWMHLPCLNARMHHKSAIANLKFDPKNMSTAP